MSISKNAGGPVAPSCRSRYPSAVAGCTRHCCARGTHGASRASSRCQIVAAWLWVAPTLTAREAAGDGPRISRALIVDPCAVRGSPTPRRMQTPARGSRVRSRVNTRKSTHHYNIALIRRPSGRHTFALPRHPHKADIRCPSHEPFEMARHLPLHRFRSPPEGGKIGIGIPRPALQKSRVLGPNGRSPHGPSKRLRRTRMLRRDQLGDLMPLHYAVRK